jgi:Protein of unknown function (DUF2829)
MSDFGEALAGLKRHECWARSGWNGKHMFIFYVSDWTFSGAVVTNGLHPKAPFIAMRTADGKFVPWLASQTDILAEDWSKA